VIFLDRHFSLKLTGEYSLSTFNCILNYSGVWLMPSAAMGGQESMGKLISSKENGGFSAPE
jgi:hypothetical protein